MKWRDAYIIIQYLISPYTNHANHIKKSFNLNQKYDLDQC